MAVSALANGLAATMRAASGDASRRMSRLPPCIFLSLFWSRTSESVCDNEEEEEIVGTHAKKICMVMGKKVLPTTDFFKKKCLFSYSLRAYFFRRRKMRECVSADDV
jgi:hypothetical protein